MVLAFDADADLLHVLHHLLPNVLLGVGGWNWKYPSL
jgi:hypothetical protein